MDSKQFSELLVAKRNQAGLSIDQLAKAMGVTPYVVQDVERGIYHSNMEMSILYITALDLRLVLCHSDDAQISCFSTYETLGHWAANHWPATYSYCENNYGKRHFAVAEIGSKEGITRNKFFECAERDGYTVELLNDEQIAEMRQQLQDKAEYKNKKNKQSLSLAALMLFIAIYPCVKWVELMNNASIWMHTNHQWGFVNGWMWSVIGVCIYIIAIPYGVCTIITFLCSLPFTHSVSKSCRLAIRWVYLLFQYFIGVTSR